ncbi:hypothetical protein BJ508DRAFT_33153 [Ascobolus immersus RN42]|uniref:Uncharacterized protein n=1 Tax=Ascobolus immersus RN42 TaxID=1160509 RepID=A0A3N4HS66_ASCIM|nr:hypothetical protein BJ508DRAFT_33153 [Ascobolus immersus RN42]
MRQVQHQLFLTAFGASPSFLSASVHLTSFLLSIFSSFPHPTPDDANDTQRLNRTPLAAPHISRHNFRTRPTVDRPSPSHLSCQLTASRNLDGPVRIATKLDRIRDRPEAPIYNQLRPRDCRNHGSLASSFPRFEIRPVRFATTDKKASPPHAHLESTPGSSFQTNPLNPTNPPTVYRRQQGFAPLSHGPQTRRPRPRNPLLPPLRHPPPRGVHLLHQPAPALLLAAARRILRRGKHHRRKAASEIIPADEDRYPPATARTAEWIHC